MKRLIRRIVYAVPGTQARWVAFNKALGREGHIEFSGWGMTTESTPPWLNGGDALACDFARVHTDVVDRVKAGTMKLSQLNDVQDTALRLQELMWRHYVVFWSASYAATATALPSTTLVECGVCDGLTAYFAMRAAQRAGAYRAFLYDAWEGMKTEYLLTSEQHAAGSYSYLSIENTAEAAGQTEGSLWTECFTGNYPGPVPLQFDKFVLEGQGGAVDRHAEPLPTGESLPLRR